VEDSPCHWLEGKWDFAKPATSNEEANVKYLVTSAVWASPRLPLTGCSGVVGLAIAVASAGRGIFKKSDVA
jgi:hypothetical protein